MDFGSYEFGETPVFTEMEQAFLETFMENLNPKSGVNPKLFRETLEHFYVMAYSKGYNVGYYNGVRNMNETV